MRRNAYGKLSLRDMRFALKVNKSLMNEGFRELKWTCPLFYTFISKYFCLNPHICIFCRTMCDVLLAGKYVEEYLN